MFFFMIEHEAKPRTDRDRGNIYFSRKTFSYETPYSSLHEYYETEWIIDGGVIANNPSLLAYM